MTAAL